MYTCTGVLIFVADEQKAQYRRRVREFNTKLAECKQERAMENFDHKNAIAKLTEEKAVLSGDIDNKHCHRLGAIYMHT